MSSTTGGWPASLVCSTPEKAALTWWVPSSSPRTIQRTAFVWPPREASFKPGPLITTASVVLARDFRDEAKRTVSSLGLDGLSREQLSAL